MYGGEVRALELWLQSSIPHDFLTPRKINSPNVCRYKRDEETGLYSLQTMRFEAADLDQKTADDEENTTDRQGDISLDEDNLEEDIESVIMDEIAETLHNGAD